MLRNDTFKFRINAEEREQINLLAQYYSRSRGDMLRYLILAAIQDLPTKGFHRQQDEKGGKK